MINLSSLPKVGGDSLGAAVQYCVGSGSEQHPGLHPDTYDVGRIGQYDD